MSLPLAFKFAGFRCLGLVLFPLPPSPFSLSPFLRIVVVSSFLPFFLSFFLSFFESKSMAIVKFR